MLLYWFCTTRCVSLVRTVPALHDMQDAKCACGNSNDLYTSGPPALHFYLNCLCLVKLFILDGHIWRSWFVLACMIVISLNRRGCSYFSMHDYIHLFAYYQPIKDDNRLKEADQYDQCMLIHEIWWNLRWICWTIHRQNTRNDEEPASQ